jgi:hypothetical protein
MFSTRAGKCLLNFSDYGNSKRALASQQAHMHSPQYQSTSLSSQTHENCGKPQGHDHIMSDTPARQLQLVQCTAANCANYLQQLVYSNRHMLQGLCVSLLANKRYYAHLLESLCLVG